MSQETTAIRYGLIGCGNFGRFAIGEYARLDTLKLMAMADGDLQKAKALADDTGLEHLQSVKLLLLRDDIDLVHIATPPSTHKALSIAAMEQGKHVLCEKPIAMTSEDAKSIIATSQRKRRVVSVNLIMRYNPLAQCVSRIISEGVLGAPLSAVLTNCAADEFLPHDHWFWDKATSGGIFVEHGVHFFDLFNMWFGEGQVVSATRTTRPDADNIVEQVQATALYGNVLATFYHGFHQAKRMDRQEIRIICEKGDIRLFDWVPTHMEIDALVTNQSRQTLLAMIPHAEERYLEVYGAPGRDVTSRHKVYAADGRCFISGHTGLTKEGMYGVVLRELMSDTISEIRNRSHRRRVTEFDALIALDMAITAEKLASGSE